MDQNEDLIKVRAFLRKRRWWLILPFFCIAFAAAAIALILPNMYRSTAVIMIQSQQIPSDFVQSTVTGYVDQRIEAITQQVKSRTNILHLAERFDLFPQERQKMTTEDLVEITSDRIRIEPINAEINRETQGRPILLTIAFRLSYEDETPKKAQLVTTELASYYLQKNLESRGKDARGTTEFLEEQLRKQKGELETLEEKLADYRQTHLEELPEFMTLNMKKLEKLNADISNVNMQIRSLEEQRSMIRNKLVLLDPFSGASNEVLSHEQRHQQAQLELALLISKYSDKHPLVLAKKRENLLLEEQVQAFGKLVQMRDRLHELEQSLAALKSRYSEKHPAVKHTEGEIDSLKSQLTSLEATVRQPSMTDNEGASNPAYVALKSDLDKMEISIASLQGEKSRLKRLSETVYAKLHAMPQVAKEYNELEADHQVAKTQYREIQQKLLTSQVSQGMEEEQLGESFRIVEPAFLPEAPHEPNRLAIMLIGMVLGMGVSIGLAFVIEYTDNKVHDARTLEKHTGFPVFSVIPRIVTHQEKSQAKRRKVLLAAAALSIGVVGVLAFHCLVMDLYVFYAKVVRLLNM